MSETLSHLRTPSAMNKIIVYEHRYFQGLSKEFTSDVPNLIHENFNNCISSLKVIGNPWVAYEHGNYEGTQSVYEEGEHAKVEYNNNISSLELVTEDLDDPQITLYEQPDYGGRSLVLRCETNLTYGSFNDKTSSHKVQRGAWVLYQHKDRGGYILVARAGRDVPKYEWFDNRMSHIRPLTSGKSTVKAEVEWDKKEKEVKTVIIDSITGVNHGSETQTFTTELSREYSGSVTESFNFSNSSHIGYGTKFDVTVFGVTVENTLNVSNTLSVEKGGSNTRTTTEIVRVSLPARIPPRTKLTVNVLRKELAVTVPVKMTITTGFRSKVEYGEYRCVQGNTISTEFKEEKI